MELIFQKYQLQPFVTEVFEKLQGYEAGTVTRSELTLFLVGKGSVTHTTVSRIMSDIDLYYAMQKVKGLDVSLQKVYETVVVQIQKGLSDCMLLHNNVYAGNIIVAWADYLQAWIQEYAQSLPDENKAHLFAVLSRIKKSGNGMSNWRDSSTMMGFELSNIRSIQL